MDDRLGESLPLLHLSEDARRLLDRVGIPGVCRAGRMLYYQGDRADSAYLVISGSFSLVKHRSDRPTLVMGTAGPGEWLGLAECIMEGPYLCDAVSVDNGMEVKSLRFLKSGLITLRRRPDLADLLLDALAAGHYRLHAEIIDTHPLTRIARYVNEQAVRNTLKGGGALLYATQEEIAAAIGVTRETVNKYLHRLEEEGMITIHRGYLEVPDLSALEMYIPE